MKITHLVKVRFDRRGPHATQEWFDRRLTFFGGHTVKSLHLQTTQDWTLWINADDDETMGMVVRAMDFGHPEKVTWRPFVGTKETIYSVGDGVCPIHLGDSDYVFVTRIDSDDLYRPDALSAIRKVVPRGDVETSIFARGYVHDVTKGGVGVYVNPSSPFHTLMIPTKVFVDPARYGEMWHKVGDHSKVRSSGYKYHVLDDYMFTVLIHGGNFLSDFDYRRTLDEDLDPTWSIGKFLEPPVIFDVDDLCDQHAGVVDDLDRLKNRYPRFRCTVFTIPEKTSPGLLQRVRRRPWIEVAVHGISHDPNEELKAVDPGTLDEYVRSIPDGYARGFRPPGWYIQKDHARVLSDARYWVAIHNDHRDKIGPTCRSGYYACGHRWPYWHGHAHDVCGNWVHKHLESGDRLLSKWQVDQRFGFVSEAIVIPQKQEIAR